MTFGNCFIVVAIVLAVVFIVFNNFCCPIKLLLQCRKYDKSINLKTILGILKSGCNPKKVLNAYLTAKQASIAVSIEQLKTHKINCFEPETIVNSIIISQKRCLPIDFETAVTLHVSGKNPLYCIKQCTTPQVISTKDFICHTKDGDCIKTDITTTLLCNCEKLLDGKDEEYFFNKLLNTIYEIAGKYSNADDLKKFQKEICERIIKEHPDYNTIYKIIDLTICFRV